MAVVFIYGFAASEVKAAIHETALDLHESGLHFTSAPMVAPMAGCRGRCRRITRNAIVTASLRSS